MKRPPSYLSLLGLIVVIFLSPEVLVASPLERGLDTATVIILSDTGQERGTLKTIYLAETPRDKYLGLSDTGTLKNNQGMLFVYNDAKRRRFVMRDMNFPLDILFFDADQTLRSIHHADPPNKPPARSYTDKAQWVLEVNYNWTLNHNVVPGDQLKIIDSSNN